MFTFGLAALMFAVLMIFDVCVYVPGFHPSYGHKYMQSGFS